MVEKEVKETKYSKRGPIDLNSIPIADTEIALEEFSIGSIGMCKCLRAMWQRNLKTYSCSATDDDLCGIAYIIMKENKDIFSYLSPTLICNDMVMLDYVDGRERIVFAGKKAYVEAAILDLVRDITSGKKKNKDLLEAKIGKPLPDSWLKEYKGNRIKLSLFDK